MSNEFEITFTILSTFLKNLFLEIQRKIHFLKTYNKQSKFLEIYNNLK